MKTTFGSRGSRLKHNILTGIAIVLFVAALVCSIVALVKSPDKAPPKNPSISDNGGNKPSNDKPAKGTVKTISEVKTVVTYLDSNGEAPIMDIATTLLEILINTASASEETAYNVTSFKWETLPAIFDHTMDTSFICASPLASNVWFVNGKAKVEYTGTLTTGEDGQAFLGGRYIVKSGKNYTLYSQSEYESMDQDDLPPAFAWGEFDPTQIIATAEMTLSNGVKLAMTFEEVEEKMNGFESVDESKSRQRTAVKGGYTFTFSLVDSSSTSATDWGLPRDGSYYLTAVEADETCKDEFPRGIKIGDDIQNVFTKFPCSNTKLQQWASQKLYGSDTYKANTALCILEFRTSLGSYRIFAQNVDREAIAVIFDKNQKVKGFEWIYQQ